MVGFRSVIAALGFVVLATAGPAMAADSFSAGQISKILQSEGYPVQQIDGTTLAVVVEDQVMLVGVDGPDGDVSFLAHINGVTLREIGREFIDEYNQQVKFGRAYTNSDGSIAIQYDRNSDGGVSAANILSDFSVFIMLVHKFRNDMTVSPIA